VNCCCCGIEAFFTVFELDEELLINDDDCCDVAILALVAEYFNAKSEKLAGALFSTDTTVAICSVAFSKAIAAFLFFSISSKLFIFTPGSILICLADVAVEDDKDDNDEVALEIFPLPPSKLFCFSETASKTAAASAAAIAAASSSILFI